MTEDRFDEAVAEHNAETAAAGSDPKDHRYDELLAMCQNIAGTATPDDAALMNALRPVVEILVSKYGCQAEAPSEG